MFKRLHEVGSIIFISIIVISAGYTILMRVKPDILPEDNVIEELVLEPVLEYILDAEEGSIDLTPLSPEENRERELDRREFVRYSEATSQIFQSLPHME